MGKEPSAVEEVAQSELRLIEELARRYDHHYYAWNHWAWLSRRARELAAGSLDKDFPKLAHATPSHYGLFHHRLVRLSEKLFAGQTSQVARGWERILPGKALDTFAEERHLAS